MNNRHNQPRYRFEPPVPRPAPQNETPEARLKRLLAAPERDIRDNKSFLAALRATVESERDNLILRRIELDQETREATTKEAIFRGLPKRLEGK